MPQKLPMLFGETAKIQVSKDVAQQNESLEMNRLQKRERGPRLADL